MERFYIIAPALVPAAYMIFMFAYFCVCTAMGRRPEVQGLERRKYSEIIGPLLTAYFIWLIRPIERAFISARVSPNLLTAISMALCASAGIAVALGYLATAAWAYILAGMCDVLDGRLARATNRSSQAGAFLDSVSDRWGELFVFAGFMWFLHDSLWLFAVMLAIAGSMMVSYTRARGEGLGLNLDGGTMQRAERILIVAIGTFLAAWWNVANPGAGANIIGVALVITGAGSAATSIGRWIKGYKILKAIESRQADDSGNVVMASTRAGHDMAQPDSRAA